MFVWQKKEWFCFLQVQSNLHKRPPLHNGHLSTTALFFSGQSIHSLLFQPLYNGHLSTMATSLQRPPLQNVHLSTTAIFWLTVRWQSIHSLLLKPLYNGYLSTMATSSMVTSQLWPPLYNTTSLQQPPLHNGHLSTTAIFVADSPYIHSCFNLSTTGTSVQWPPLYHDHLSTTATSLQRPFFGRQSVHSLLFQPLYNGYNGHFLLSPMWPL